MRPHILNCHVYTVCNAIACRVWRQVEMKAALRFEFLLALVAVMFCVPAHAQSVSALGSARIVFVGHSLINYDMPEMVKGLAESKGLGIRRAVQVNNGTNIGNNWLGCRQSTFTGQYAPYEFACDAIESGTDQGPYDTLIVTQVNNPIIDPSNAANLGSTADDYEKFLNLFLSKNRERPGVLFSAVGRYRFALAQWSGLDRQHCRANEPLRAGNRPDRADFPGHAWSQCDSGNDSFQRRPEAADPGGGVGSVRRHHQPQPAVPG